MLPTYIISISDVGSSGFHELKHTSIDRVKQFLNDYDHEGSAITLKIITEGEDVYELLRTIQPDVR